MHVDWFTAGWLQPGRLVVEEQRDDSRAVQVRLDCGVTWQRTSHLDPQTGPCDVEDPSSHKNATKAA